MPAKPLTPEQQADARRLKQAFKDWQAGMRESGARVSQETASDALGFGQSALSQYLNGTIPLNAEALKKFCKLLGVAPAAISPGIVRQEVERAMEWLGASPKASEAHPKSEREAIPNRDDRKTGFSVGTGSRIRGAGLRSTNSKKEGAK